MSDKKNTNWTYIAIGVSAAYSGVLAYIIGLETLLCFLKSPELNALGDFLAGTFAPLAVIWLVAAVLTQRQEIKEARLQFKTSQEVITKQLKLVEKQNIDAEQQSIRTYKLDLFPTRFAIFSEVDEIARQLGYGHTSMNAQANADRLSSLAHKSLFVFPPAVFEELSRIAGLFQEVRDLQIKIMQTSVADYDTGIPIANTTLITQTEWDEARDQSQMKCAEIENSMRFASRTQLFKAHLDVNTTL